MKLPMRSITVAAAFALLGGYVVLALRGPQGLPVLLEKREEIRRLEVHNQELRAEIDKRRERIRQLDSSKELQELEIRKRLKLQHQGDTTIYLPNQPETPSGGAK